MRKMFVALLLLIGASAFTANFALAFEDQDGIVGLKMVTAKMAQELQSRANQLGTSTGASDTTWVGYTPGHFSATNNYWSIYSGFGKSGYKRPINGQPNEGLWDWDTPVNGDSLQGWWPMVVLANESVPGPDTDRDRPWTCIDYGNQANYVINESRGANWQNRLNGPQPGWRTIGVDGVWHRDGGSTVAQGSPARPAPTWAPIQGSWSAWMGLRADGDNTTIDPGTLQPFTQRALLFNQVNAARAGGSDKKFPGYGTQMDQILYRDIDFTGKKTANLTVTFSWRTDMSTSSLVTAAGTRFGWFDKDPLGVTAGATNPQLNNFISGADAGANAPVDSFMVYIGSGVDGNQWRGSDGNMHDVYDPKHRWFSEVLHTDTDPLSDPLYPQPLYYKELLSVAGNNAVTQSSFTIDNAALTTFLQKNNKIRLAFRVKTNLFFDDERTGGRTYSSGGAGAAVVDGVSYQLGSNPAVNFGTFELASDINNDPAVSALDAWKSTGKPPAIYQHIEQLGNVRYEDLCGQKGDAGRICNMTHGIVSMGNHDDNERSFAPVAGRYDHDGRGGLVSPTIVFAPDLGPGDNVKNSQGLLPYAPSVNPVDRDGDIYASEDWYIHYDLYAGIFDGNNGNYWRFGFIGYPCQAADTGYPAWGVVTQPGFIFFNPAGRQCFIDNEGARQYGILRTSNANGIPDSIKIHLQHVQLCYSFGVPAGCNPTDGAYWDNVALAIVDGHPAQLAVDIWQWIQDSFPANETPGFPGNSALFDTCAAYVKTGNDTYPRTNDLNRYNVPGDSVAVQSSANTARVDMVFRILPGPGNYQPIGQGHTGNLRKVPTNPATVAPGDGSYWDVLRTNTGEFSSNPGGPMTGLKAGWNPNFWLSVRCDTADANLGALQGRGVVGGPLNPSLWMSTIHESDKRFELLGIVKNRCFVRCEDCALSDIVCDGTVPTYYPGGTPGTTKEGTKMIPDGLLTPGAHVEYFFRDQKDSKTPGPYDGICPDTNTVTPQITEGPNIDGHRWQEFSILPDRWKDPAYVHPVFQKFGHGPACLLVVDWNDRRGDERVWVSVADTIGATSPQKWGAHNGWHAAGGQDINSDGARVAVHGGSPGTTWDFYQVKASESIDSATGTLGARGSFGHTVPDLIGLKTARTAPTKEMLDTYYQILLILTGDLNSNILGPFNNVSNDDVGIIEYWLDHGSTEVNNRGIWAIGDGFVEANTLNATETGQVDLIHNYFRADLVNENYLVYAGNSEAVIKLRVFPEWQGKSVAELFGLRNVCIWSNDVLTPNTPELTTATSQYEENSGPVTNGYYAGIFKDWDPLSPYKALVDGWDLFHLTTVNDVNTVGRSAYMYKIFTNVWGKIWNVQGTPVVPLDVPTLDDGNLVNFMNLADNPMYGPKATIKFGLAKADRVSIVVFDVGGRKIRTVVDRAFTPGTHEVVWDGRDDGGRPVARGVFFTQVRFAGQGYVQAKKLAVLR